MRASFWDRGKRFLCGCVCFVFCCVSGFVPAVKAKEKSVAEEILEILKANHQITPQQYDQLMEKAKKERLSANDFRVFFKEGLNLQTAEGNFKMKIGGRIMTDFAVVGADDELEAAFEDLEGHGFEFRRARLYVSGTLYDVVDFKSQFDFAGQDVDFKDVYIGLRKIPGVGHLRVGHVKEPFSLEELTSSKYITFMERGLPNAFSPGRNTGVLAFNDILNERVTWAVGAFQEVGDSGDAFTDFEDQNISARITGLPWFAAKDRLFHLGLSYTHRFRSPEDNPVRFRARPEIHIVDDRLVDTKSIAADGVDILNPEAAVVFGPFSLQGEYFHSIIDSEDAGDPEFNGFYVYASVFLTGEHRNYKPSAGAFSRVKPKRNFHWGKGGWGAWEAAFRYSRIDLNDEAIEGGKEDNFTLGLNWYWNPNTRVMLNYVFADLKDREGVDDGSAHLLGTRFQVDF